MTVSLCRRFAIGVVALVITTPAAAQDARTTAADSLVRVALSQAREGDTTAALATLGRATRVAPRFAPAHFQRGVLLSRTSRLGMSDALRRREANKAINRALDLDRNNPFYLLELGRIRLKTPFLRLDAERLFRKALAAAEQRKDPRVLAEVHFELGSIYERRYLTMANRRMIVGDVDVFDAGEAVDDWRYTSDFLAQRTHPLQDAGEIDFRKAEDHFRAALAAFPGHVGSALGLLGLLYDLGRYEEMVLLAGETLRHAPDSPRLLLALGLAQHRIDRDVQARLAFDSALALLPVEERNDMVGLETVLRREAASSYANLPVGARAQLDSTFWAVADPLALTPLNEAQIEFFARVAYADLRFSSQEFGTRGWKTDRGIIHIRYGHAPVVATFAPSTSEIEGSEAMGKVTTVWWYPDTKMRFVFVGPPAMNYASFAGDFRAYADNARHNAPLLFDNLEPRLRVDSVPVQVARFRGEEGNAEVLIYADIPTGRMLRGVDVATATLETGLFLTDGRQRPLGAVRDSAVVRLEGRDRVASRSWTRNLPIGEYSYRVESREPASGRSARALAELRVVDYPAGRLSLSDILVARRIVPRRGTAESIRERGDLLIVPNASLSFLPGDTMSLYWEAYGAAPDSSGTARLEVELALRVTELTRAPELTAKVLGGLADAIGLSEKGDDRIALRYRFDRAVPLDSTGRIPNFLALELGNAPPGKYLLQLTVKDLVSGRTALQERPIIVPRP